MSNTTAETLALIEAHARERCAGHDAAHDILHVTRVVTTARVLAAHESGTDMFVVEAAAWLHDIVQLPKGSGEPGESAQRSADEASVFLRSIGMPAATIASVCDAIRTHSFSGGLPPATLEAAIVQDADRIDALGAIGIARLWVTAAVLDSDLYELHDPGAEARALADREYGLDHIEAKLLKLPDLMHTATGREIARERTAYVKEFRDRFLSELAGHS